MGMNRIPFGVVSMFLEDDDEWYIKVQPTGDEAISSSSFPLNQIAIVVQIKLSTDESDEHGCNATGRATSSARVRDEVN